MSDTHKIILVANDAEETKVPISAAAAKHAVLLNDLIEDVSGDKTIPCVNVTSGKTLQVVVAYLEEYQTEIFDNVKLTADNRQLLLANNFQNLFNEPWVTKYRRPVFNADGKLVAAKLPVPIKATATASATTTTTKQSSSSSSSSASPSSANSDNSEIPDEGMGEAYRELFVDVLLAAEYLSIDSLIHIGCHQIALLVKGKTKEQLEEIFETIAPATATAVVATAITAASD